MARMRYNHNSFSIGFLSKRIQGNTDFEGYNNALDECVNFVIQPTGGLFKRTGTYFVSEAKTANPRLILFSYSAEDQYVLEFGDKYIRYFTKYGPLIDEEGKIIETMTDFSAADVHSMSVQQDGNILILITSEGLYTLTRTAVDAFKLEGQEYSTEPLTFTNNEKVALKPSATTGEITITVVNPSNDSQKPDAKYAPFFNDDDIGHFITLSYRLPDAENIIGIQTYYLRITAIEEDTDGFKKVTAKIDSDRSYNMKNELPSVTSVTRWQLGAFTETRGTPKASAFYEGRLFLANNKSYPTGIWGSSKVYMDWTDFYAGTNDADAVMFKMSAQNTDEILWLAAQAKLFAGTRWGIYVAGSATYNDEAITPSNFRIRLFEASGASSLQPVIGMDSVFFVDVSGKKVHEIHLSSETGAYQADDISLLSDDLTQSGIVAHTWQQNPIQTYWCAVQDGYLCSLTYLKNNGIMAWAKHEIMGNNVKIEQLCTMHGDKNDLVWMVVRREIDGKFKRYIEYMHAAYDPLQQEEFKQFYVDSGVTKQEKSSISNIDRGSNPQLKCKISSDIAPQLTEMISTNNGMFEVAFNGGVCTIPSSALWISVCYGNNKFVAIGDGQFFSPLAVYSTDGITWKVSSMPSSTTWNSVCYGNDKFVAVADGSNKAAYSLDGITWTRTTLPSSTKWSSVCYGNDKFVAVADGSNKAVYSENGITWKEAAMPSKKHWHSVCYGNGKFVAVAYGDKAVYSENGITWKEAAMPSLEHWSSVCYENGKFVAVTNGTKAAYSEDGISWTAATLPSSADWSSVCYGNGKFVAVSFNDTKAAYSEDGISWSNLKQKYAPWNSSKKYYLTNLSITQETSNRYLIGTLFDYYDTPSGKAAGKIKASDFNNTLTDSCALFINVSQIFGLSGNNVKCDTRHLVNNDSVLLFDTDIPNYDTTREIYVIKDKAAETVKINKNSIAIRPSKGSIFKAFSTEISVNSVAKDCIITLEDDIADHAERVYINKVTGMTQINKQSYKVASISANKKEITLYDEQKTETCGANIPLDASNFSPFDTVNPNGNVYVYFSEMGGLNHLEGQTVDICADGNKRDSRVVKNGKISFKHPVMYCSAGLAVKSWLKTTPFSGGSVLGSSVGAAGGQKSMWLHLYYSLGGRYGSEKSKTYPIPYLGFISGFDKPKNLISGLIKCPISNSKDVYDRSIYIEHTEPLAFNILSITQDIEVSDS